MKGLHTPITIFFNLLFLLPKELFDYFGIKQISVENKSTNIYIDVLAVKPDVFGNAKLTSKGFLSPSVQDFPLRGKYMFFQVRRRRWQVDSTGKVVSRDWATKAKRTRFAQNLRFFKTNFLYSSPISNRSIEKHYHIYRDQLDQQSKNFLSYNLWDQKEHASDWMLFTENVGKHLLTWMNSLVKRRPVHDSDK